ncbi:hypothetical protein HD597_000835 [Nonomuraea thailandensis]|uniref:Chitin-binding type-3 domain-containing protein n=1 Tax=Nonomuraea thailandensis TaxID=1188745 RepID=A0A9X2JZJ0_9ACTN|nr:hypothetical protein [Nonomuraea thailandensis]MCP2353815.1 hypothetical protein [Nonomuraea thailandensis]
MIKRAMQVGTLAMAGLSMITALTSPAQAIQPANSRNGEGPQYVVEGPFYVEDECWYRASFYHPKHPNCLLDSEWMGGSRWWLWIDK